jgi:hypothetical protein
MHPRLHRLRTALLLVLVCLAGSVTAVAVAKGGGGADDDGTTTGETTGTTGETGTTGTGTTGTGTTGTGTTTTPRSGTGSPRIQEIEVDSVSGGRLRLRAEIDGRVTSVRFTYRNRRYKGRRSTRSRGVWTRVVRARGGDGNDVVITVRVRACSGSRCTTRTGRDDA